MLFLAGGIGLVALFFVVAGLVGALAAGAAMGTGTVLIRRALSDRRERVALIDIQSGLRMLGRELRAGAEPSGRPPMPAPQPGARERRCCRRWRG